MATLRLGVNANRARVREGWMQTKGGMNGQVEKEKERERERGREMRGDETRLLADGSIYHAVAKQNRTMPSGGQVTARGSSSELERTRTTTSEESLVLSSSVKLELVRRAVHTYACTSVHRRSCDCVAKKEEGGELFSSRSFRRHDVTRHGVTRQDMM